MIWYVLVMLGCMDGSESCVVTAEEPSCWSGNTLGGADEFRILGTDCVNVFMISSQIFTNNMLSSLVAD